MAFFFVISSFGTLFLLSFNDSILVKSLIEIILVVQDLILLYTHIGE